MLDEKNNYTTEQKIEIMKAHIDGAPIEYKAAGDQSWTRISNPNWNWLDVEYRQVTTRESVFFEPTPLELTNEERISKLEKLIEGIKGLLND